MLGDWEQLEDVDADLMGVARQIKHVFTGDLLAKVTTNPHFKGLERDLLRCQLARIMHSTTLCPADYMKLSEGGDDDKVKSIEPNVEEGAGWKPKANEELSGSDKWTY